MQSLRLLRRPPYCDDITLAPNNDVITLSDINLNDGVHDVHAYQTRENSRFLFYPGYDNLGKIRISIPDFLIWCARI